MKHGKGRYKYVNGDNYSGDWFKGQRHGVGIYHFNSGKDGCCLSVRMKATWNSNMRTGPFELYIGNEDKCTILHGIWDNLYPSGPAVFSFNNRYLLLGYFLPASYNMKAISNEDEMEDAEERLEDEMGEAEPMEPTLWFAQEMAVYDFSLLPQEPVPLAISDSELSVCSLSTEPSMRSEEKISWYGEGEEAEGEEGGEMECFPCECDLSDVSEVETESEVCKIDANPCCIEILKQPECPDP